MSHVAHLSLQAKPGAFQKVCDRYHQFAQEVLAGHPDLHDVIIVGNQAQNIVEGFGIWENAEQAASLEDTEAFAKFLADNGEYLKYVNLKDEKLNQKRKRDKKEARESVTLAAIVRVDRLALKRKLVEDGIIK